MVQWRSACVLVVLGCGPSGASDDAMSRDPGEDIDVRLDLPAPGPGSLPSPAYARCKDLEACILGPSVRGTVLLDSREAFVDLSGIRCIYGSLTISGPGIVDLRGLEALEVSCDPIVIENNPDLVDTIGLEGLDPTLTFHEIRLVGNAELTRVSLPATYAGHVYVSENDRLEDLAGLAEVRSAQITTERSPALLTLGPLASLESGAIRAIENPRLEQIVAPHAEALSLFVSDNPALEVIDLPRVATSSSIYIEAMNEIPTVVLTSLREVERITLARNEGMPAFPTLPPSVRVERVEIEKNAELEDLTGLSTAEVESLRILFNPALDQAYAEFIAASIASRSKVGGNAGWVMPMICPFENDGECDEVDCFGSTELCIEGSDWRDCCGCRFVEGCQHGS
jgi:hypothetical protein